MTRSSGQLVGRLFKRVPPGAQVALLRILSGIEPDPVSPDRADCHPVRAG